MIRTNLTDLLKHQLSNLTEDLNHDELKLRYYKETHVEFHLISYCLVRVLQLAIYMLSANRTGTSASAITEETLTGTQAIRCSLSSLQTRLQKYRDDVILVNVKHKEDKLENNKDNVHDLVSLLQQINGNSSNKEIRNAINHELTNLEQTARELGCGQGELTLSNDMAHILDIITVLINSIDKSSSSNDEYKIPRAQKLLTNSTCPSECPFCNYKVLPSEFQRGDPEDVDSELYSGSELSIAWSSSRDAALRDKHTCCDPTLNVCVPVPKLDFSSLNAEIVESVLSHNDATQDSKSNGSQAETGSRGSYTPSYNSDGNSCSETSSNVISSLNSSQVSITHYTLGSSSCHSVSNSKSGISSCPHSNGYTASNTTDKRPNMLECQPLRRDYSSGFYSQDFDDFEIRDFYKKPESSSDSVNMASDSKTDVYPHTVICINRTVPSIPPLVNHHQHIQIMLSVFLLVTLASIYLSYTCSKSKTALQKLSRLEFNSLYKISDIMSSIIEIKHNGLPPF